MAGTLDRLGNTEEVSIAYVPVINTWRGTDTVELELRDIRTDGRSLVLEND
jgi:hypothetical protein